jgi:hypothetical protein
MWKIMCGLLSKNSKICLESRRNVKKKGLPSFEMLAAPSF